MKSQEKKNNVDSIERGRRRHIFLSASSKKHQKSDDDDDDDKSFPKVFGSV